MPGTRRRTAISGAYGNLPAGADASTDNKTAESAGPGSVQLQADGRRSSRHKSGESSETSPHQPDAGPEETPKKTSSKNQVASSPGGTPAATPRKRGRPRKQVKDDAQPSQESAPEATGSNSAVAAKDETTTASGEESARVKEQADRNKGVSASIAGSEKSGDSVSGHGTANTTASPFSPRRSGRGVVPNRRFQDMELDFGRKRMRDEADTTDEKTVKKRAKKGTAATTNRQGKGQKGEEVNHPHRMQIQDKEVAGQGEGHETVAGKNTGTSTASGESQQEVVVSSALEDMLRRPVPTATAVVQTSHASTKTADSAGTQTSHRPPDRAAVSAVSKSPVRAKNAGSALSVQTTHTPHVGTGGKVPQHSSPQKIISVAVSSPTAATGERPVTTHAATATQLMVVAQGKGKVTAVPSPGRVMAKTVTVATPGSAASTQAGTKLIIQGQSPRNVMTLPAKSSSLSGPQTSTKSTAVRNIFTAMTGSKEESSSSDVEASPVKLKPVSNVSINSQEVMSLIEVSPNKTVPVIIGERRENVGSGVKLVSVLPHQHTQPGSRASDTPQPQTSASQTLVKSGPHLPTASSSSSSLETSTVIEIPSPPNSPTTHSVKLELAGREVPLEAKSPHTHIIYLRKSSGGAQDRVEEPASSGIQVSDVQKEKGVQSSSTKSSEQAVSTRTHEMSVSTSDLDSNQDSDVEDADPKSSKFATSGTQTPYHKKTAQDGRQLITVRVQPPDLQGQPSTSSSSSTPMTVSVVKREIDDEDEVVQADEDEESVRSGEGFVNVGCKQEYIVVNVPEGSTIKQPYIKPRDKLEDDPSFFTVDEQGLYHCHTCDYKTDRKPNFYKHKRKHLGIRPHKCDLCPYRAATSSNLKRHLAIHADLRSYRCHICNLHFRQKIHLERHIKYKHEEKKVKCPLCDYVCANENPDLKVHIRRKHVPHSGVEGAKEAFTCGECGMVAMSKRDLRQHAKFHSKGPELKLFCQMCSFVTDCESRLRRHQYIHTKEKPFQCGLCDYRGSQKEHVLRHMRSQHNIEIVRKQRAKKDGRSMGKNSGEEGSPRVLERADYTSEEKIFACNHCTMKFAKLINLYKHLHTQHRDIMPAETGDFACVVCDFHTTNKKNLLVHMRKHNMTDQCPPSHVYSCVLCRYMNPKRRNLFQHMRKKHHIEIVLREDGTTTCYVANEALNLQGASGGQPGVTLPSGGDTNIAINMMSLNDVITTVAQPLPSDLQMSREDGNIAVSSAMVRMEDLAMVVSNPNSTIGSEGCVVVEGANPAEGLTMGTLSQNDAAEAIQGLQALAERGALEASSVVEEQVQVMAADEQATLVIDPTTLGVVEQLVQPKAEPLEVVEIDESQLLDDVSASTTTMSEDDSTMLDTSAAPSLSDDGGLQLSAEQLMNLATGDYIEINGEMYKVEVSNNEGAGGQQVISIEPASLSEQQKHQQTDASSSLQDERD